MAKDLQWSTVLWAKDFHGWIVPIMAPNCGMVLRLLGSTGHALV